MLIVESRVLLVLVVVGVVALALAYKPVDLSLVSLRLGLVLLRGERFLVQECQQFGVVGEHGQVAGTRVSRVVAEGVFLGFC